MECVWDVTGNKIQFFTMQKLFDN